MGDSWARGSDSDSVDLGSNPGSPARELASNRCVFVVSSVAEIVLKLPRVSYPAKTSAATRDAKCLDAGRERPQGLSRPFSSCRMWSVSSEGTGTEALASPPVRNSTDHIRFSFIMLGERFRLTGKAMIHSSRRERKTKAIAEVLAMIADAHPELVRGRPRPRKTDEWLRESATEFCAALDRHAEHAMENRRPPGRASLPARPRRHTPKSPLLAAEREKVVVALRPLPHAALAARLAQGCAPKNHASRRCGPREARLGGAAARSNNG